MNNINVGISFKGDKQVAAKQPKNNKYMMPNSLECMKDGCLVEVLGKKTFEKFDSTPRLLRRKNDLVLFNRLTNLYLKVWCSVYENKPVKAAWIDNIVGIAKKFGVNPNDKEVKALVAKCLERIKK